MFKMFSFDGFTLFRRWQYGLDALSAPVSHDPHPKGFAGFEVFEVGLAFVVVIAVLFQTLHAQLLFLWSDNARALLVTGRCVAMKFNRFTERTPLKIFAQSLTL